MSRVLHEFTENYVQDDDKPAWTITITQWSSKSTLNQTDMRLKHIRLLQD